MDEAELYFLILHFLKNLSPCHQASNLLQKELLQNRILPKDYEILLKSNPQLEPSALISLVRTALRCDNASRSLCENWNAAGIISDPQSSSNFSSSHSQDIAQIPCESEDSIRDDRVNVVKLLNSKGLLSLNKRLSIERSISLSSLFPSFVLRGKNSYRVSLDAQYSTFERLVNVLGHTYPVYCVAFDKANRRLITAGDDGVAKIWCVRTGMLISSFRGHDDNISDMSVSSDNQLLATAAEDKTIKIWNLGLRNIVTTLFAPAYVHTVHFFAGSVESEFGYLLATFSDGFSRIWKYNTKTLVFEKEPMVYSCKLINRDNVRCAAVSKGGLRFAVGGTDGLVRLFVSPVAFENIDKLSLESSLDANNPLVHTFADHQGYLTNLTFSNCGDRLASGSLDGTCRIYYFDPEWRRWKSHCLEMKDPSEQFKTFDDAVACDTLVGDNINQEEVQNEIDAEDEGGPINEDSPDEDAPVINRRITRRQASAQQNVIESDPTPAVINEGAASESIHNPPPGGTIEDERAKSFKPPVKPRMTMVIWTIDDEYLVTASSDYVIRVWDSRQGTRLHSLKFHESDIFVLTSHPIFPELVLSAGYDGKICLWNIYLGTLVKYYDESGRTFLDGQFSEDGLYFALTDESGRCALFGLGGECNRASYENTPFEQFRLVDFDNVAFDANRFPLHESLQIAPHDFFGPLLDGNKEEHYPQPIEDKFGWDLPSALEPGIVNRREQIHQGQLNIELNFLRRELKAYRWVDGPSEESLKKTRHRRVLYGSDNEEESPAAIDAQATHPQEVEVFPAPSNQLQTQVPQRNWNSLAGRNYRVGTSSRPFIRPAEENFPAERGGSSSRRTEVSPRTNNPSTANRTVVASSTSFPPAFDFYDDESDGEFELHVPRRLLQASLGRHRRIATRSSRPADDVMSLSSSNSSDDDHDNSEQSDEEEDEEDMETGSGSSSNSEEEGDGEGSSRRNYEREERKRKKKIEAKRRKRNLIREGKKAAFAAEARTVESSDQDLEAFFPGRIITSNERLVSLYMPQVGDFIAYFRQGHEILLSSLKKDKNYRKLNKGQRMEEFFSQVPFEENPELPAVVGGLVTGISYHPACPAYCSLQVTLFVGGSEAQQQEEEEQEEAWKSYQEASMKGYLHLWLEERRAKGSVNVTIKIMENYYVSDYVILWSLYHWGMKQKWQVGEKILGVYLDGKSPGIVTAHTPWNVESFPTSPWNCFWIRWEDKEHDEIEKMNPWELTIPTKDDQERSEYEDNEEIPVGERNQLLESLRNYCKSHKELVKPFIQPVSLTYYPDYCVQVAYPMDLRKIQSRLKHNYYRRIEALHRDLLLIHENAYAYNLEQSQLVKDAKRIVKDLEKICKLPLNTMLSSVERRSERLVIKELQHQKTTTTTSADDLEEEEKRNNHHQDQHHQEHQHQRISTRRYPPHGSSTSGRIDPVILESLNNPNLMLDLRFNNRSLRSSTSANNSSNNNANNQIEERRSRRGGGGSNNSNRASTSFTYRESDNDDFDDDHLNEDEEEEESVKSKENHLDYYQNKNKRSLVSSGRSSERGQKNYHNNSSKKVKRYDEDGNDGEDFSSFQVYSARTRSVAKKDYREPDDYEGLEEEEEEEHNSRRRGHQRRRTAFEGTSTISSDDQEPTRTSQREGRRSTNSPVRVLRSNSTATTSSNSHNVNNRGRGIRRMLRRHYN